MSNKVVITCDSTSDLSSQSIEKYGIKVNPLTILKDDKMLRDGIDITSKDIFEYKNSTGKLPKTCASNLAELNAFFTEHYDENSGHVHFSISGEMSSTFSNSKIAGASFEKLYTVDSRNLSTGIGLLILKACELRDEGKSAKEIYDYVEEMKHRVDSSFVLDTLEYLHKGGRCSSVAVLGANILRLKPCIEVVQGKMDVGKKYRGNLKDVLISYVKDRLADIDNIEHDRIFVTNTMVKYTSIVEDVKNYIKENYPFKEILETHAGSTISVHCGPECLGILFVRKTQVK